MTGFSLSVTVTLKLQLALLPLPSSAVQLTVVVPLAKAVPLAGLQVTLAVPQLSAAVALKVTLLEQVPGAVSTVMSAGQWILALSCASPVSVKLQAALLPLPSSAVQLTVVVPLGK